MCRMRRKYTQGTIRHQEAKKNHYACCQKRLIYDVIHLQRQHAFLFSNDAKSCYNCIVQSVASIAMQWLGMPENPMKCMLQTLEDLEHHIRISYSTSESFMHNDSPITFQGMWQCNGSCPTIWVAVSAPLIEMMRGAGHGIKFESLL